MLGVFSCWLWAVGMREWSVTAVEVRADRKQCPGRWRMLSSSFSPLIWSAHAAQYLPWVTPSHEHPTPKMAVSSAPIFVPGWGTGNEWSFIQLNRSFFSTIVCNRLVRNVRYYKYCSGVKSCWTDFFLHWHRKERLLVVSCHIGKASSGFLNGSIAAELLGFHERFLQQVLTKK